METAEEFFREKIKENYQVPSEFSLANMDFINAEKAMIWAYEYYLLRTDSNNNGWIIIENESQFPEIDLEYKVGKMLNNEFHISNGIYEKEEVLRSFLEGKITHYFPIEKPQPPIY